MTLYKRKLFTRTPYEHYGTGIASGLADERPGFAVGGRVNFQEGGGPSIQETIQEGQATQEKESLFKGREKITSAPGSFNFLSPIGKKYYYELNKLLNEQGINVETFRNLPKEQRELLAEQISNQILFGENGIAKTYNVDPAQLEKEFGGDRIINNTIKGINTIFNLPVNFESRFNQIGEEISSFEEENASLFEPLPSVQIAEEEAEEAEEKKSKEQEGQQPPPTTTAGIESLGDIKDRTSDQFRKKYVDYLKSLQDETELEDKRRRQAVQAGFINFGAADPVQEGESTMQAFFKSFQDPMAKLREADATRAEDIYKRGADQLDDVLAPSESRDVLLIQQLVAAGIPELRAIDIVTGRERLRSQERQVILGIPEVAEALGPLIMGDPAEGVAPKTAEDAIKDLTGEDLTDPLITAPNISGIAGNKDGGRVGLQEGGTPPTPSINAGSPAVEPMTFEELREKLPSYISDEVVSLLSQNPQALMDLAQAQTDRDLRMFEKKYGVDVTMPLAEEEAIEDEVI